MNFIGYFNTDVRFMYNVYKGGGVSFICCCISWWYYFRFLRILLNEIETRISSADLARGGRGRITLLLLIKENLDT